MQVGTGASWARRSPVKPNFNRAKETKRRLGCLCQCQIVFARMQSNARDPRLITNVSAKMVKARKWVLRSHFVGQPKREDLEIVEEELPPVEDGGQS